MNNKDIERLYIKYRESLIGLAMTKAKNRADAEDAVQDVFALVLQDYAFHAIENEGYAKNLLEKMVIARAIDAHRRRHGEVNLGDRAEGIEEKEPEGDYGWDDMEDSISPSLAHLYDKGCYNEGCRDDA